MRTYGLTVNADGDSIVRTEPYDWGAALPAAGDFPGHLYYLTTGATGWHYWDGAMWMGPLGVAGGGGGAPVSASYVTLALHATLTNERRLVAGSAISIVDGGPNTTVTVSVPDATTTSKGAVELATDGESAANIAVQGNDARMSNARTPTGAASGDLTGTYPSPTIAANAVSTAKIADAQVTNAKLANMANGTMKARISAGAGPPDDTPFFGTVFPTVPTPIDGQTFYHTTDRVLYVRDVARAAWLSVAVYEISYGDTAAVPSLAFFRMGLNTGMLKYSATVGHVFGFPVCVVGISWRSSVPPAATITVAVTEGGVTVTGGTMAVGTAVKTSEALASSTIPTEARIGVRNSSGNSTGNLTVNGTVRLRRVGA